MNSSELFRVHHGLVFRTAYRITGNAGDAEDVLQTVFLRLLRRGRNAERWEIPKAICPGGDQCGAGC